MRTESIRFLSFAGTPRRWGVIGHIVAEALEEAEILSGVATKRCYIDRGYRGVEFAGGRISRSNQHRGVNTRTLRGELKRPAIEAVIGYMKNNKCDHQCGR